MSYKSLNLKVALILIVFGTFLLTILFVLVVPKMEKQRKDHTTKQIENMITLTRHQLILASKSIQEYRENRVHYIKSIFESKIETIHHKLDDMDTSSKEKYMKRVSKDLKCDLYTLNKNKDIIFRTSDKSLDVNYVKSKTWNVIKDDRATVCPKAAKEIIYSIPSHKVDEMLVLSCDARSLDSSMSFEYKLKKDIQHSFSLTEDMHKGKIYLMWLDMAKINDLNKPLYNQNDDRYFNNKYCVSKISNLNFPRTGLLSTKEIVGAVDKEPIKHMIDKDNDKGNYIYPAFTWVRSLEDDGNRKFLFITTVLEEDFDTNDDSYFWKILPTSLLALFTAILVGLFIFRRLFKTMNILTDTAKEINSGNLNVRSNIKGEDDIGLLGTTFDKMLDSLEKNIHSLDKKVESRTKELQSSLEEKETLLKEIHHRVKNNLAMIIELIKIQKSKLKDASTKEALVDIQERVFTMELLHRKLYESKDLHFIDFKKYVLDLVSDLNYSYGSQKDIKIDIDMQDVNMSVEYALPCGLIINECITNSFKYAFEKDTGKINISLKKDGSKYILKIFDDGLGIPDHINIDKPKTLGLKLLSTIVKSQLLGKLTYSKEKGSEFIVEFEVVGG